MDDKHHSELLHLQASELGEKTSFCPEDQVIAEFYDGGLEDEEKGRLERHFLECRYCRARIGAIERLEAGVHRRIPEDILATAKQMKPSAPERRTRHAPAWAAAAVLVIALGVIIGIDPLQDAPGPSPSPGDQESARQLRSVDRGALDLEFLTLTPGQVIRPGALIRWAGASDSLHYDLFVLSNAGDVLWTERLRRSEWTLDESLQLASGQNYYLRVEASLADGRRLSSKHLEFQVAEPE